MQESRPSPYENTALYGSVAGCGDLALATTTCPISPTEAMYITTLMEGYVGIITVRGVDAAHLIGRGR